jgi:tetratricopeptide (TPR) repeat protein
VKLLALAITVILLLSSSGSYSNRARSDWGSSATVRLAEAAHKNFIAGHVEAAMKQYDDARKLAADAGETRATVRLLISSSVCDLTLFRYRMALAKLMQAHDLTSRFGDCESQALISVNLSSIYLQMDDFPNAKRLASEAVALRQCITHPLTRAQLLLQLGWMYSLLGDSRAAIPLFVQAVNETTSDPGSLLAESGLDRLGAELLRIGDLPAAEAALSASFRLRLLSHDPLLFITRYNLANLKFAQGDFNSARQLIDRAIASSTPGRLPPYLLRHLRGRILAAQGDLAGAVDEFREAVRLASKWRGQILPADSARTSADAGLQNIYDSFIAAAIQLYSRHHEPSLLQEAWEISEENRTASLRETSLRDPAWRINLPAVYWDLLAELRSLESPDRAANSSRLLSRISKLRVQIGQLETEAGLVDDRSETFAENNLSGISLNSFKKVLGNTRTLMTFHLGASTSYRWDTGTFPLRVLQLPSSMVLNKLALEFRDAVECSKPNSIELGRKLYSLLFAGTDPRPSSGAWLLALEGRLFDIPFGALVTAVQNGRPRFLLEDRAVEIVPGAWAVGTANLRLSGPFLGVADPVYNHADARFAGSTAAASSALSVFSLFAHTGGAAELPRLIGSGREIANCARQWPAGSHLLTGTLATRVQLREALRESPSVIHIAAHFVLSPKNPDRTMIALSLAPAKSGRAQKPEMLTASGVAALRVPGSLVVLSGCSSAAGRILPGAGLLGLSRAWIAAGASGVIASHWPTPDDSGELFANFYRYLRNDDTRNGSIQPAEALRRAQLDMLRSSNWRSSPRYWAAYQLTERSNATQ